jgi:hypothetical protein
MSDKIQKFSNLSTDIENIVEIDIDKIKNGEYEIESVIDVFLGEDKEYNIVESGIVGITTDLTNKEAKRGDTVYITAMLRKSGTTSFSSPSIQSVLKCRIVDIYHGLSYLNKYIK